VRKTGSHAFSLMHDAADPSLLASHVSRSYILSRSQRQHHFSPAPHLPSLAIGEPRGKVGRGLSSESKNDDKCVLKRIRVADASDDAGAFAEMEQAMNDLMDVLFKEKVVPMLPGVFMSNLSCLGDVRNMLLISSVHGVCCCLSSLFLVAFLVHSIGALCCYFLLCVLQTKPCILRFKLFLLLGSS
jgi:hypothetical protein